MRSLSYVKVRELLHYVFLSVLKRHTQHIGDDKIGGTPVPIPNTEVKTYDAEDTRDESLWENMELPIFYIILVSSVGRACGC